MTSKCNQCGKRIKNVQFDLYAKSKPHWRYFGAHCSRQCAEDNAWGPIFRSGIVIRRKQL